MYNACKFWQFLSKKYSLIFLIIIIVKINILIKVHVNFMLVVEYTNYKKCRISSAE